MKLAGENMSWTQPNVAEQDAARGAIHRSMGPETVGMLRSAGEENGEKGVYATARVT
jgi:hypothetical protein